jgi:hypothetical protein
MPIPMPMTKAIPRDFFFFCVILVDYEGYLICAARASDKNTNFVIFVLLVRVDYDVFFQANDAGVRRIIE